VRLTHPTRFPVRRAAGHAVYDHTPGVVEYVVRSGHARSAGVLSLLSPGRAGPRLHDCDN
jgi:hypothetical protein